MNFGACFRRESKDGAVSEHSPDDWDELRVHTLWDDWEEVGVCALLASLLSLHPRKFVAMGESVIVASRVTYSRA